MHEKLGAESKTELLLHGTASSYVLRAAGRSYEDAHCWRWKKSMSRTRSSMGSNETRQPLSDIFLLAYLCLPGICPRNERRMAVRRT